MKRITIIGGGASGTLLAINLLKEAGKSPVEINLVESRQRIGRGVAFGTIQDTHLLNVPAGRMGAFPDDVGHFHTWLTDKGHVYEPNDFVPRMIFGEYLRDLFENTVKSVNGNARVNLVDDEAVDMSVDGDSAQVMLRSGEILPSHRVILAFGNFKPPHPSVNDLSFITSAKYYQDPWNSDFYETVGPDDSLLVVGTGLSMVDVVMHLYKTGHKGKISAISTRGLLPAVHKLGYTYPEFNAELLAMTRITDMLKTVRRHTSAAAAAESDWRAVIDNLRPATQQIWLNLPIAEKRYFMQHLSRYWNVARHRMPPEAGAILDEMKNNGQLDILKGRLTEIAYGPDGFRTAYTSNGSNKIVSSDILVNCIGSESNFARVDSSFVKNLIERGHIRNDELSLGIDATPDGSVRDKNNRYSPVVFTLGTALKGRLWESTAIPEIRSQARQLALKLLAE